MNKPTTDKSIYYMNGNSTSPSKCLRDLVGTAKSRYFTFYNNCNLPCRLTKMVLNISGTMGLAKKHILIAPYRHTCIDTVCVQIGYFLSCCLSFIHFYAHKYTHKWTYCRCVITDTPTPTYRL